MSIEVDDRGLDLKDDAKKLSDSLQRNFDRILKDVVAEIKIRTLSGRDVNGAQFQKYSEGYATAKAKKTGRSTPNLLVTGLMQGSIQSRVMPNRDELVGLIYFANPVAAARAEYNI